MDIVKKEAMGKRIRALCWLMTGLFLAYDLYLWGGLAITPTIGDELREQSSLQAPIAASYLFLGRQLVDGMGQSTAAREFAARRFPALVADTESRPETVLTRFLSAQGAISRLAYYGAPLLLLLSLTLQAMRPKPIRSFGGRG